MILMLKVNGWYRYQYRDFEPWNFPHQLFQVTCTKFSDSSPYLSNVSLDSLKIKSRQILSFSSSVEIKSVDQFNSMILSIFHCCSQCSSNYIKKLLSVTKPMYHQCTFWILYNVHSFDRGKMSWSSCQFMKFLLECHMNLPHTVPQRIFSPTSTIL